MATHGAAAGGGGGGGPHKKFFKVLLPGSFELRLVRALIDQSNPLHRIAPDRRINHKSNPIQSITRCMQSIPPKFAAGLGGWHRRRPWRAAARLLRDGRSWDVDLHRDDGGDDDRVFLTGGGWRGFVSANGISAGQLLVFEHRGCLDLAVDIFDASGCLISVGNGLFREAAAAAADTTTDGNRQGCRRRPPEATKRRRMPSPTPSSTATTTTTTTGSGDDDDTTTTLCRRIERPHQLRLLVYPSCRCRCRDTTNTTQHNPPLDLNYA
jgi:hypothetical protein